MTHALSAGLAKSALIGADICNVLQAGLCSALLTLLLHLQHWVLRYRLVYSVEDQIMPVTAIAIGRRDRNELHDIALSRIP